jgi:hypothetical protein
MKESYGEGVARHTDPESCAVDRKVKGEALTGVRTGQPLSGEIILSGTPTLLSRMVRVPRESGSKAGKVAQQGAWQPLSSIALAVGVHPQAGRS